MVKTRPSFLLRISAITLVMAIAACTTVKQPDKKVSRLDFTQTSYASLPNTDPQSWQGALTAFKASCTAISAKPLWRDVCRMAATTDPADAQAFFEKNFSPWLVEYVTTEGKRVLERTDSGLMTGYFEPLLFGSRTRQPPFIHPIYGVPDDLLIIDLSSIHPELKGMRLRGKLDGRRVVPYDSRADIQNRHDLEHWAIAWVDDPVSAFFLQVQGSGRILLPDGSFMRVGFADQNGYRYHSIGNWLQKNSYLKAHELSMQNIRAWAKKHPEKVKEALAQNPSFIFFEERTGPSNEGPIGAQGVPLTPQASIAVDPRYWNLGTPFVVQISQQRPALNLTQPVVAQDTGGAIKGPLRYDFFWGFGDEAAEFAGRQRSQAKAWILVPKGKTPEDIRR